jgi:hypothetical protein
METHENPRVPLEPANEPQIDTPVIDLEQRGAEAAPDELPQLDLSREDEKARKAIEEFEQSLLEQPPG